MFQFKLSSGEQQTAIALVLSDYRQRFNRIYGIDFFELHCYLFPQHSKKIMKLKSLSVALLCAGLFASCNNESSETTTVDNAMTNDTGGTANISNNSTAGTVALDTVDQNFAMKAASGSLAEIEMANMAMQHGRNERVKNYASMMLRDHGQATEQLKSITSGRNVNLPAQPLPEHMKHMEMLRGKTGAEFDRTYMQHMVMAHEHDINEFQRASTNLKDSSLRGFATRNLPILKMHLDSARAISKVKM